MCCHFNLKCFSHCTVTREHQTCLLPETSFSVKRKWHAQYTFPVYDFEVLPPIGGQDCNVFITVLQHNTSIYRVQHSSVYYLQELVDDK